MGFTAVTGMLSINTSFRTFAGYARRITDVLLVIEEVRAERAQQNAKAGLVQQGSINAERKMAHHDDEGSVAEIVFRDVDIFAPGGQQVVSNLTFTLPHGEHLRVTGPNGCGKSAVFRVLAGTWQPQTGSVHVPPSAVMVPQQPLATATPISLLAYATYPQSPHARANSQAVVTTLLEQLGIQYLLEREGLHSCKLWSDVLSLGELQCLACVRLLYQLLDTTASSTESTDGMWTGQKVPEHRCGRWAILDDCTSAMDAAVEKTFFRYAASHGISLVSLSQRESAAFDENEVQGRTRLLTLGADVLDWELE